MKCPSSAFAQPLFQTDASWLVNRNVSARISWAPMNTQKHGTIPIRNYTKRMAGFLQQLPTIRPFSQLRVVPRISTRPTWRMHYCLRADSSQKVVTEFWHFETNALSSFRIVLIGRESPVQDCVSCSASLWWLLASQTLVRAYSNTYLLFPLTEILT